MAENRPDRDPHPERHPAFWNSYTPPASHVAAEVQRPAHMVNGDTLAVACYREMLTCEGETANGLRAALPELRGKNLACWCGLDQPCHADVLLELANRHPAPSGGER